jgi:hypothetical protein
MRRWINLVESAQVGAPTITFPEGLYHIGTLDPAHKGSGSFEGEGVSVSMHPATWRGIAKLGGNPLWHFSKSGNLFLDYHALTDQNRQAMKAWGVEQGWVQPAEVWQVCWYDEDYDDTSCFTFSSEEEAQEEYEDRKEWDDSVEMKHLTDRVIGTKELAARCRQTEVSLDPLQLLATLWADDVLHLDGVWFDDNLDPGNLSAPRGVIFLSRLGEWHKEESNDWPDEDDEF